MATSINMDLFTPRMPPAKGGGCTCWESSRLWIYHYREWNNCSTTERKKNMASLLAQRNKWFAGALRESPWDKYWIWNNCETWTGTNGSPKTPAHLWDHHAQLESRNNAMPCHFWSRHRFRGRDWYQLWPPIDNVYFDDLRWLIEQGRLWYKHI